MKKRLLSAFLSIAILLSLIPNMTINAFAASTENNATLSIGLTEIPSVTVSNGLAAGEISVQLNIEPTAQASKFFYAVWSEAVDKMQEYSKDLSELGNGQTGDVITAGGYAADISNGTTISAGKFSFAVPETTSGDKTGYKDGAVKIYIAIHTDKEGVFKATQMELPQGGKLTVTTTKLDAPSGTLAASTADNGGLTITVADDGNASVRDKVAGYEVELYKGSSSTGKKVTVTKDQLDQAVQIDAATDGTTDPIPGTEYTAKVKALVSDEAQNDADNPYADSEQTDVSAATASKLTLPTSAISISDNTKTYNAAAQTATVAYVSGYTEKNAGKLTVSYKQNSSPAASPTDAGAYDIFIETAGGTIYKRLDEQDSGSDLTINKAIPNVSITAPAGEDLKVFSGATRPAISGNITGVGGVDLGNSIQWTNGDGDTKITADGNQSYTATPSDETNYETVTGNVAFTIKSALNTAIALSSTTAKYNGSSQLPTATVQQGGVDIDTAVYTLKWYSKNEVVSEAINAGTYTAKATINAGFTGQYNAPADASFTISKATFADPTNVDWTNDTTAGWTAVSGASSYTVELKMGSSTVWTYSNVSGTTQDCSANMTTAGTYTYTVKANEDDNHIESQPVTSTSSKTVATPTYTVAVSGDYAFANLTYGNSPIGKDITITNTGNQAGQAIDIEISDTTNFELSKQSVTLGASASDTVTVTPKTGLPVGNYSVTLTAKNHNQPTNTVSTSAMALAVEKKQLNVASDIDLSGVTFSEMTYNGKNQTDVIASGEAAFSTGALVNGDDFKPTVTYARKSSAAGNAITVEATISLPNSGKAVNYSLNTNKKDCGNTVKVNQKEVSCNYAAPISKPYDGNDSIPDAVKTAISTALTGVIEGDTVTIDTSSAVFASTDATQGIAINGLTKLSGTDSANYTLAPVTLNGTITQADLTGAPLISLTTDNNNNGAANVDDILTVAKGTLNTELTNCDIQWLRNGAEINGATGTMYTIDSDDVAGDGKSITCKVTAKANGNYKGSQTSNALTAGKVPLTAIGAITGTAKAGQTLTAGVVSPTAANTLDTDYTLQWYRDDDASDNNGTAISGANAATYTLADADIGKYVYVAATGINDYTSTVTSDYTAAITKDITLGKSSTVTIKNGETLTGAQFLTTINTLAPNDTLDKLFSAAVIDGAANSDGVTVTFYKESAIPGTWEAVGGIPSSEGTYKYTVGVAAGTAFKEKYNFGALTAASPSLNDGSTFDGTLTIEKTHTSSGGGGGTPSYKVSFDAGNNGKIVKGNASVSVNDGSKLTESKLPTVEPKEGYKFLGWSVDGKTVVDPTSDKITKAVTYIALYGPALTDQHIAYIKGYDGNVFRPDANITRAEMATIIARVLDEDIEVGGTGKTSFSDVASSEWYAAAIAKMEAKGIMNGYADGTFQPNANISREELAAVVARMNGVIAAAEMPFTDVKAGAWSADSIYTVYKNGWVSGYSDGTFRPSASITRAETVRIMNGMLSRSITADSLRDAAYSTFFDIPTTHWAYFDVIEASNEHDYSKTDDLEVWTK